jgi:signal transduction histidine kinase
VNDYIQYQGFHHDGRPYAAEEWPLARSILSGEIVYAEEIEYLRGDKSRGTIQVSSAPIRDQQGNIVAGVVIFTDITEQRAIEQRKDEFISMASHELKTPVTSIKAYTQVLRTRFKNRDDEETVRFLTRMDTQLTKLSTLISDLLDVTKMQTGKLTFREERFMLDALVKETVENVQEMTPTHRLVLESEADVPVYGDKDRIGQVVINLLTNAIKYSPHADTVVIRVSVQDGNAVVSIQDFGIGIAEAHQAKIFERFYQVTDPMEKTFPGLGIGLYISNEIIRRYNGQMEVESTKGQGSTFSFRLPLQQQGGAV